MPREQPLPGRGISGTSLSEDSVLGQDLFCSSRVLTNSTHPTFSTHRPHVINFSATCDKGMGGDRRSDFFTRESPRKSSDLTSNRRSDFASGVTTTTPENFCSVGEAKSCPTSTRRPHSGLSRSAALRGIRAGYVCRLTRNRRGQRLGGHRFGDGRGGRPWRLWSASGRAHRLLSFLRSYYLSSVGFLVWVVSVAPNSCCPPTTFSFEIRPSKWTSFSFERFCR